MFMVGKVDKNGDFQVIAVRGIVINSKNELLVVSENDDRWHLPGGWVEIRENALPACEREVHEEVGMVVKAEKIVYVSEYLQKPYKQFTEFVQKFDLYCVCKIIGDENINHDWKDPDNNLIQHRKFISNDEWKNGCNMFGPKELRQINLIDIQKMISCYTKL
jgi:ADP-ribose pyrophosphatase YjhB (NUDIX family)